MDIVELGKTQRSMENHEEIHEWLPKWTVILQMMAREQLLTDFPNTKAKEHGIFEYQEADSVSIAHSLYKAEIHCGTHWQNILP